MGSLKFLVDADDVLLDTGYSKVKWMRTNLTDDDLVNKSKTAESIAKHECTKAHIPYEGLGRSSYVCTQYKFT